MKKNLITAFLMTVATTILLGIIYPLVVTGLSQLIFPAKANGELIRRDGKIVGSRLIGQSFTGPRYFHSRLSSAGNGYDAANSGASNLGPTSQKLNDAIKDRLASYRQENGLGAGAPVPADAVTASGSGLDPHISVQNAALQVPRVAKARGLNDDEVRKLVRQNTDGPDLGFLGEAGVNVLKLNLALDAMAKAP